MKQISKFIVIEFDKIQYMTYYTRPSLLNVSIVTQIDMKLQL